MNSVNVGILSQSCVWPDNSYLDSTKKAFWCVPLGAVDFPCSWILEFKQFVFYNVLPKHGMNGMAVREDLCPF